MKRSELKALIKEVIQESSSQTPYCDYQLGDGNDVSVQDCLEVARRFEIALREIRSDLSAYVHGDEELSPSRINQMLDTVEKSLSGK